MAYDIAADIRLDPRIKALLAGIPLEAGSDVDSRETHAGRGEHRGRRASRPSCSAASWTCATPRRPPRRPGCASTPRRSSPRRTATPSTSRSSAPTTTRRSPASTTSTAAAWRRCRATTACTAAGARSSRPTASRWPWSTSATRSRASSAPEVAPFPAGLNDCVSGLKWVVANAGHLGIDPARIVVAGESGGGNLTLATGLKLKQDGDLGLIKGLYALCPYIARRVADARVPVLDREQRHPARPAQQPRRDRLRHRGVQRAQPAGLAVVRHRRRRRGLPADGDQRQRVRPAARRGHRLLPAAAAAPASPPAAAR